MLKQNLPAVLNVGADEVICVDDASPTEDYKFIQENFPQIKVLKNPTNLGFGRTVNKGVAAAKGDIVILLNQDVKPQTDILKFLKTDFKNPQVFGVSLAEAQYGPTRGVFKDGYLMHEPIDPRPSQLTSTFWVSGGSGAFRRSMWDRLGGFDPIYEPGYWEDLDLSWQAHRQGWQVLWDPRAQVEHVHEQSFGGVHFDQAYKHQLQERNHLLFNWKNLTDPELRRAHLLRVIKRAISHPGYLKIVLMALQKLPALKTSTGEVSDREILLNSD